MNTTRKTNTTQPWTREDGARLRTWRERRSLSQRALGKQLGVSGRAVGMWEAAMYRPGAEHRQNLSAIMRGHAPAPSPQMSLLAPPPAAAETGCAPTPQPAHDPYTTTIDWQRFAYTGAGASGISLRAMVDAGLYASMHKAVEALRRESFASTPVRVTFDSGQRGEDHILSLRDAQRLAMRARTEVGHQIAELILDHHDEFQRLLTGDTDAHARLAAHTPVALSGDPILDALTIAADVRRQQLALRQQVQEQGVRLEVMESKVQRVQDEDNLYQLAHRAGWMSTVSVQAGKPKPHVTAVLAALRAAGHTDHTHGVRQHMLPGEEGRMMYAIGGQALQAWPELVEYYGRGSFAVVCPVTGKTMRVTRVEVRRAD
jgi:transcriptional regulator with XRE-family HTH domain